LTGGYRYPVEFVTKANGNCPSKEFYDGLSDDVKAKFIAIAKAINKSSDGFLRNTDKLEKLHGKHTDDLWEMKVWYKKVWYRMLCFRDNSTWRLTNGFEKEGNDTRANEIRKGVAIKKEYYSIN
jgi:hypothetical protein